MLQAIDKIWDNLPKLDNEQLDSGNISQLSFEERLSILLDREKIHREDRRLSNL